MIEAVHTAIESESVHRLAETLFHFLWQGAVIYLGIWFLRRLNSNERGDHVRWNDSLPRPQPGIFHEDPRWRSTQSECQRNAKACGSRQQVTFRTGMPYYSIAPWCK